MDKETFDIFYLEDLKGTKTAIETEDAIYLSPAMYRLWLGYKAEGPDALSKFVSSLTFHETVEDSLPDIQHLIEFIALGHPLTRSFPGILTLSRALVEQASK